MSYSKQVIKDYQLGGMMTGDKDSKDKHHIFKLKVSESEKYDDDGAWFEDIMEYHVPSGLITVDDYDKMKSAYELVNNDHTSIKEHLQSFCNSLGENLDIVDEEVLAFPVLHNKINIHKGEMLKRNDHHKVILLSAKAIRDRDEQLLKALQDSVEEEVQLEIQKTQQQMQGMSPEEADKYIQGLRTQKTPKETAQTKFHSEFEIFYNKALKFGYQDQSFLRKKMETIEDACTSGKFALYSGFQYGKPTIDLRNPLHLGWHKSPNQPFIHKSDYVWYKSSITLLDAIDKYDLEDDQIDALYQHSFSNNKVDSRSRLGPHKNQFIRDHTDQHLARALDASDVETNRGTGLHQATGSTASYYSQQLVTETHFEFKAYRKLTFLTYLDEYNKKIITPLPSSFKIPKSAVKEKYINKFQENSVRHIWLDPEVGTEYTAEVLYIPRRYEVTRLGEHVYVNKREVPNQPLNLENPYSTFTLSTFGSSISARNSDSISPIMRAIPSYMQYIYIKHLQNRELKKYQGYIQNVDVDQIPLALGQDIDGNLIKDPIAVWKLYRKQEGINFYSGSQNLAGGPAPSTRAPGSSGQVLGTASEIFQLEQLAQMIKVEVGMAMGISPQREAQFDTYSNVQDNQQAISQSYNITEPLYFIVNEVWKDALNDYLYNFRTYADLIYSNDEEDVSSIHYFLPDGTEEILKITPKVLQHINLGLFVSNSGNEQQYNQMMLQMAQTIGQNAEAAEMMSEIIKSITQGISPEETHKLIATAAEEQQKRISDLEQMKAKQAQELQAQANKAVDKAHQLELDTIDRKGEWDVKVAEVRATQNFENNDINNNQIPDVLEVEKFKQQVITDNRKLDLEDKKLNIQDRKNKLDAKNKSKPK